MIFPAIALSLIIGWWIYDLQFQWRELVDYQYGWLVAIMAAYLAWERWPTRPRTDRPVKPWIGLSVALLGAPFVLLAELYKQSVANTQLASFTLSVGCTLFSIAVLLLAFGRATTRHFRFPLLFIYVAVPLPGVIWNPIVLSLQELITSLNVATLQLVGIPAVQQVSIILLPNCSVGVDEACSGVRSLQSSIMAALFIGDLTLRRAWVKWALLVAGIGLAVAGNYLRSLYLTLTAYHHGLDAIKAVHDVAGWSILAGTAAGLIALSWAASRFEQWSAAGNKSVAENQ
jgi:exosortase